MRKIGGLKKKKVDVALGICSLDTAQDDTLIPLV